jgi:hypothetical protein
MVTFGVTFGVHPARADPLRLRGDAYAQTSSPVGLLVLQGEDRMHPTVDAEAVAWLGVRDTPDVTGDVQTLTVRVRDVDGRGEARFGRFLFSAGAIRPLHVDGARGLVRTDVGTSFEAFAGAPVVPRFAVHEFDWAGGGRVAQSIGSWLTFGGAFVERRAAGSVSTREIGPDFAIAPAPWIDLAARAAFDLVDRAPTDALASIAFRFGDARLEAYGTRRSPSHLLPATSLFSVLGDVPATTAGASFRWRAAPRLELMTTGATVQRTDSLGGSASARTTLALDDAWTGSVAVELRRDSVSTARWWGARTILVVPFTKSLRGATELEIVRPDDPPGKNAFWPWALFAATWRAPKGWDVAAGVEIAGTRDDRREVTAMLRASWAMESVGSAR